MKRVGYVHFTLFIPDVKIFVAYCIIKHDQHLLVKFKQGPTTVGWDINGFVVYLKRHRHTQLGSCQQCALLRALLCRVEILKRNVATPSSWRGSKWRQ